MEAPTPELSFKKYLAAFNSIKGLVASVGVLLPGFIYFTKYPPPLFPGITLLTAAFATATILITYYYPAPTHSSFPAKRLPPILNLALKAFLLSIVLLVIYVVLLDLCTVLVPGTTERMQIGFYKFNWSLTDYGRQVKATKPFATPQQWLWDEAYGIDAPKLLWRLWSIYLSGILMIVVFISAFVFWTFAWSLVAKEKALSE